MDSFFLLSEDSMSDQENETQFYSAAVNAWFATSLEHDRSLLTLSAAGIGLLITLLTTVGASSIEAVLLYFAAMFAFLICVIAVLWIFRLNGEHIRNIIHLNAPGDPKLKALDALAKGSFLIGVMFSLIIGVCAAIHSLILNEACMSGNQKDRDQSSAKNESFDMANILRPQQDIAKKSFEDAASLRRPVPAQPPEQTTSDSEPIEPPPKSTGNEK